MNNISSKPFLEQVTEYILLNHREEMGSICVVTPNRRAGLFIRKFFSKKVDRVIWAPETLSIEDFINRLSRLQVIDKTSLVLQFYEIYLELQQEETQTLDAFLRWAPVLLNDIDEADANIDDPRELFTALGDVKRIETWNPDGSPLTSFQERYLSFFANLGKWHEALTSSLLKNKQAYQGLSSKQALRMLASDQIHIPWSRVYFIGFNALNLCEERIIRHLLSEGKATYWQDADNYYVNDIHHEAGHFIRKYRKMFGHTDIETSSGYSEQTKQISILGIARNVNQARLAGNILLQHPNLERDERTAIVLANEKLLMPVLNALPDNINALNVTMGYPINKTNLYWFFDAVWKLYLSGEKNNLAAGTHTLPVRREFYHKEITRLLRHPATALLWHPEKGKDFAERMTKAILSENKSFLELHDLERSVPGKEAGELFRQRFAFLWDELKTHPLTIFQHMLGITSWLDHAYRQRAALHGGDILNSPYFVDFEALYHFSALFRRMQGLTEKHKSLSETQTLYTLYKQLSRETSMAFSGEPLEGLQLMGMLETRNLDFKNIILLSANENILPAPKNNNSFIPYDLKKRFGLLVHSDIDAIYAYHFYRLLQRAENIYLIYNTQTEDMGNSEKSRFLTQLQMELPSHNHRISIEEHIVSLPLPPSPKLQEVVIEKNQEILDGLIRLCKKGFSPSALNAYIHCPLHFYLTRLAGIEEPEEIEETLEAATIGSVVHGVLESLFLPYAGKIVGIPDIDNMIKQTRELTKEQFNNAYPGGDLRRGKNLLLYKLSEKFAENLLSMEKASLQNAPDNCFTVLGLEQEMETNISVMIQGTPISVKVKGKADRIDRWQGKIRIIDYKSGKTLPRELMVDNWELIGTDPAYSKVFQLLTYAYLYQQKHHNDNAPLVPGIISLREASRGFQNVRYKDSDNDDAREHLPLFEKILIELLTRILDKETAFTQTQKKSDCRYCTFITFCQRK